MKLWRYCTDDTGAVTFHSDFIYLHTTTEHIAPKTSRTPPPDLGVSRAPWWATTKLQKLLQSRSAAAGELCSVVFEQSLRDLIIICFKILNRFYILAAIEAFPVIANCPLK